jgi:exosortase A-associated hydrolase 1
VIARYRWAGGEEAMLRFGPDHGPVVVAALPLFEEANRTRTFTVALLRALADRGIAGALPDLPGQGESVVATEQADLAALRAAFAGAVASIDRERRRCYAFAIRSGALLDTESLVFGRWHLAPQSGPELFRELNRLAVANGIRDLDHWCTSEEVAEIAGNRLACGLVRALASAERHDDPCGSPLRTVRFDSDPRPADLKLPGAPLWRRAEPDHDPALAACLADDLAAWVRASDQFSSHPHPSGVCLPLPSGEGGGPPPQAVGRVRVSDPAQRTLLPFPCAGETLLGTLDQAPGSTGLLIVSGGNEVRMGAHRGMASLARRVAAAGYPVFRFDRRGIGDSTGENGGYASSADDIAAAAAAFRRNAGVSRIVAYGNCDAASALAFFHARAGVDALVLANPWTVESAGDLPPPAAIRARYVAKLRDPRELFRLFRGGVNIANLIRGLRASAQTTSENPLAQRLATALSTATVPITLLLASGDNTAIAFADAFARPDFATARERIRLERRDTASHSFASQADKDWLFARVAAALAQ